MKTIGIIKELDELETRVALVPQVAEELIKSLNARVLIDSGAGLKAGFSDSDYALKGCFIKQSQSELIAESDIIITILGKSVQGHDLSNKTIIALFEPYKQFEAISGLKNQNARVLALELIPRISRAQSMDVLSSQANIAGYVAVLQAAAKLNKIMPMMMTAAGTIKAAQVLVLGAGVAGLSAIATAKRLGAIVHAYDVRSVVKEQVESLGAKFVNIILKENGEGQGGYAKAMSQEALTEQRAALSKFASHMDIIITTAQIPGKSAPILLNESIFSDMSEGSVIIDLASKSGGNIKGSVPNLWTKLERVWLYGADELARMAPRDASLTFSKNIAALIKLNNDDEIVKEATLCEDNQWLSPIYSDFINTLENIGAK